MKDGFGGFIAQNGFIILGWFLYVIISVDRFDIITPQGIEKGIKKEKILFGLVFIACACINPGIEFATLAWKETFIDIDSIIIP